MVAAIPCGHPNNLEHTDEFKRESVAWQLQPVMFGTSVISHNAKLIHYHLLPSQSSCGNKAHIDSL